MINEKARPAAHTNGPAVFGLRDEGPSAAE
jgi:hypothetical protein